MKKTVALILVLLCILAFSACGEKPEELAQNPWGITLDTEKVTPKSLTIVCQQSGGENVAELNTGSYFVVQKWDGKEWVEVAYAQQDMEVMWTAEAWMIPLESTTQWDVNWEWLYGDLPAGEYRIGKEIMNFRGPGDYDTEMAYANFTIQ